VSNTSKRNTINLETDVYSKLKQYGKFGETYSNLILRLLNQIESNEKVVIDK
jgi:predicted CopG family antitoxin